MCLLITSFENFRVSTVSNINTLLAVVVAGVVVVGVVVAFAVDIEVAVGVVVGVAVGAAVAAIIDRLVVVVVSKGRTGVIAIKLFFSVTEVTVK